MRRVVFRGIGLALAVALLALAPASAAAASKRAPARPAQPASASNARPDAALYRDATGAEQRLRSSARRSATRGEWESVVLRYRRLLARYPRSGYCDNSLLAIGNLYRDMARRFEARHYRDDSAAAYRRVVSEYPSSSLGEQALFEVLALARQGSDRRAVAEAARAYLETYPDGRRARQIKQLLRSREPGTPLPAPPPPGLASIFDLRAWSGDNSTRIVIDLERQVRIQSDRVKDPDRLWIDLIGARLHPNLAQRIFPVGDGLLERVRVARNREDVIRVVLDFKDVWEYQLFFLENPTRLVVDVRGQGSPARPPGAVPAAATAGAEDAAAPPSTATPPLTLPSRPLPALAARQGPTRVVAAEPIALTAAAPPPTPPTTAPAGEPRRATPTAARPSPEPAPSPEPPPTRLAALPTATPEAPTANRTGSFSLARQLGLGARRIVIDAGHGGHDPGTIGRNGLQEKDLVLDVALRLERMVRQELATEVVLTRSSDVFVPLEERTAIANGQFAKSRPADLFLSIHANASRNRSARGIETYFLNFARSAHAEEVAARENAISAATMKDLQNLVKAIATNSKIAESRDFASAVQEAMVRGIRGRHAVSDRGVHTAPFYVLIGANMPAVLAEIAFVSNPEDEKRLRSGEYRDALARSLLAGVRSYLETLNSSPLRQLTDASRRSTVPGRMSLRSR